MKKIIVLTLGFMVSMMLIPTAISESSANTSGPELESRISNGFGMGIIQIRVTNVGDSVAHNVTLSQITADGSVIFNYQESSLWSVDIASGEWSFLDPNSLIIGVGVFTISMTVACDEGASSTSEVTGLILGPFYFIP
jgi:hypothetical protein